jgi:hypothetical protein
LECRALVLYELLERAYDPLDFGARLSHSLISTARAETHWFIRCPNQVIWCSNAVLFRIDFDQALQRARVLVTRLEEEPHVNPNTQTKEFSLRDPDGYYVTISELSAADKALQRPSAGPGFMGQRRRPRSPRRAALAV